MSVLLETSLGDLVLDLDVDRAPKTCENFLKLAKAYKYNYCAFFSVQKNFLAQTGDPSSSGKGGSSIWNLLPKNSPQYDPSPYFRPERSPHLKHRTKGTVSMALSHAGKGKAEDDLVAGSQFFITLADNIEYLDGKHAPFAMVVEGQEEGETLDKINASFTDDDGRPLRDIRIKHVIVLDDPFEDPVGLSVPSRTPSPTPEQLAAIRLGDTDEIEDNRPEDEKEEARRKADSSAAALTLEMVGDLPFAEIRPPENILFVCKLNPVTRSEDLELIFSRFGKILSCEVIKDKKTGDSLQYAFIEFDERESAEQAYFKMDAVLIDNQRIRVDFSQSVSKLHSRWIEDRTGKKPPGGRSGESDGGRRAFSPPSRGSSNTPRGGSGSGMMFDMDELASRDSHRRDAPPPSRRYDDRRDDRSRGGDRDYRREYSDRRRGDAYDRKPEHRGDRDRDRYDRSAGTRPRDDYRTEDRRRSDRDDGYRRDREHARDRDYRARSPRR
ncbi:cyclophilin-like protein [Microstroma glucosiphilum]|uniref:Peptidyl-prolyl cis-trans isomerase n=1 Tax=Pseudomicrostroma glucosiphilum TaxID=1684307 RepID=A0A316UI17_9BASI|nr:cyclophilin-like protein [Pseudomicrostroma glucosiphilum]PWN23961.1 cyclophilin-like protein [Pseudomicrostroma glucosiphilum]